MPLLFQLIYFLWNPCGFLFILLYRFAFYKSKGNRESSQGNGTYRKGPVYGILDGNDKMGGCLWTRKGKTG